MPDQVTEMLMEEFPAPLNTLLVSLYDRNREYWLEPPMDRTIGADAVRQQGLTPVQMGWAIGIAEQMGGDHPAFVVDDGPDPEEIISDTDVEDHLGGDLR